MRKLEDTHIHQSVGLHDDLALASRMKKETLVGWAISKKSIYICIYIYIYYII